MSPWVQGLRSAPVGAEQTSPGCLAPHLPQDSDCCGAGAHGSRSRLRLGRCRTDVPPRTSCNPSSARLRLLRGRRPWVQGLCSATVVAEQTSPRTSCNPSSARLRLLRGRRPMGPRSRLCNPSSALKWGKLNYTDFVQNCILDQKERTSL